MNKLENLIDIARLNELLGKKEEEKKESDKSKDDWNPEI